MRKTTFGILIVALSGWCDLAFAVGVGTFYLGDWQVASYLDASQHRHSYIRVTGDGTKATFIPRNGVAGTSDFDFTDPTATSQCAYSQTSAYIDLDDPENANVKSEWYSLILFAEAMKRPIAVVTEGCVSYTSTGVNTGPRVKLMFLR